MQKNIDVDPKKSISIRAFPQLSAPLEWCAAHSDQVLRIMGITACSEAEWAQIEDGLAEAGRFELLAAMLVCDGVRHPQGESPLAALHVDMADGHEGAYTIKQLGELHHFLMWCDEQEQAVLLQGGEGEIVVRLLYLTMCAGCHALTAAFAMTVGPERMDRAFQQTQKYAGRENMLYRKWVREFYARQPDGRLKRKLGSRLARYAPPSIQPLRL